MSTSLLVQAMRKAVLESELDIDVDSASSENLDEIISAYDVVLVGPQVRYRYERFKEIADREGKPIGIIEPKVYGMVDGKGAIKQAVELCQKIS